MARSPMALQLRYLQTLLEIGATNAATIVFGPDRHAHRLHGQGGGSTGGGTSSG